MKIYLRLFVVSTSMLVFASFPVHRSARAYAAENQSGENRSLAISECYSNLDVAVLQNMALYVDQTYYRTKRQLVEGAVLKRWSAVQASKAMTSITKNRADFLENLSYFRTHQDNKRFDSFKNYCRAIDVAQLVQGRWNELENPNPICSCIGEVGANHYEDNLKCMSRQAQIRFCQGLPKEERISRHGHKGEEEDEASKAAEEVTESGSLGAHFSCQDLFR